MDMETSNERSEPIGAGLMFLDVPIKVYLCPKHADEFREHVKAGPSAAYSADRIIEMATKSGHGLCGESDFCYYTYEATEQELTA